MTGRARSIGIALVVGVLAAACSSSSTKSGAPASSTTTKPTATTPAECERPVPAKVTATQVAGVSSDWDVTSFDGTKIRTHWFPTPTATAAQPAPTVLMGPGWGLSGDTNVNGAGILGAVGISSLHDAGYNVLTWDPRGFGQSGGMVTVDSAQFEGRDASKLIDWVSEQPNAELDNPGDPRMGMAGGSYGGGIQLVTAAIDCRVDAITPQIAWHSLSTSLYKGETPKNGWSSILIAATTGRSVDPHIPHAYQSAITTSTINKEDHAWFASRGPAELVDLIKIPTLIVQGTVDNLFTLDEGTTNYRILRENGVPTAMLWFCGGHGVCLTKAGDPTRVQTAVINWLDRYVKGDEKVSTGARFDFVDQNGTRYTADDYPVATGEEAAGGPGGTLKLVAEGGSGPAHPAADSTEVLAGIAGGITPAKATNAVNFDYEFSSPQVVVGAPEVTLSYRGTTPPGVAPTRVFAQIVDPATGLVVGNQITPIQVVLDGKAHEVSVPLEVIAFTAGKGAHLTLQLVATSTAYAQPRLGGSITFTDIGLKLPVASNLNAKGR